MTDFLIKTFIKDYQNPADATVREKYGVFSSIIGIITNLILATIKLVAGIISFSIAIVADALNNLSDAGSSIISFVSFKIAAKPADKEHPFGHARIEYVSSMIVSFLILIVGFELMSSSVKGLFDGEGAKLTVTALTYIILSISILLKLWLGLFYRKIAKKIDSSVVSAAAADSFSDCASTSAVLVSSLIVALTDWWFIDSVVGLAVSVMIMIAGVKILIETKNSLLGEAPVQEVIDSIKSTVDKYPEVIGIHDMLVHNYGPKTYIVSFHAEVDGSRDIYELHDTIDNIEREINQDLRILCTIHMDPIVTNDETVNELRNFTADTVKEVCPEASIHDFRTVIGQTHTNLIFDIVLPFDAKETPEAIVENVKKTVNEKRDYCYCVITVDRA
jgi:cation diffusion facilitator family transporter